MPCPEIIEKIYAAVKDIDHLHLRRHMRFFSTPQLPLAKVDGKELHIFSSSNYLSLAEDKRLIKAAQEGLAKFGTGSGGSRLTTGSYILQQELENRLADLLDYEKALLFNSGYQANVGILSALLAETTHIFSDALNHASIIDGCRMGRGKTFVYPHKDADVLETLLKQSCSTEKIIVSDGVFSMDGDIADLSALSHLAQKYNALLIIDDAHGFGTIGSDGMGIISYFDKTCKPDILVGTLSKALGSEGGFVVASSTFIDYFQHRSRSFIFSSSINAGSVNAALTALDILQEGRHKKLQENIAYMSECLHKRNLIKQVCETPIIPIRLGSEERALHVADELLKRGYWITPIRFPAVPKGQSILRLTVMADHTPEQMDGLVALLSQILQQKG